jgi:hypothetical protein
MEYLILATILGAGLLFCFFTVAAGHCFHNLVDHLHAQHHDRWEKEGKPEGGPGSRREIGFWNFSNYSIGSVLWMRWYRVTPGWAIGDLQAIGWLSRFRRWWTFALASMAVIVIGFLWFVLAVVQP